MKFSQRLILTVQVQGSGSVKAPEPWTRSAHWKVKNVQEPKIVDLGNGQQLWQQTFALEPLAPGVHEVQLEPIAWRGREPGTFSWPAFQVNVVPQITEPDLKNLRERTFIEELPAPKSAFSLWWLVVPGSVMVLSGFLTFVFWRRKSPLKSRSPKEVALHELDRLRALKLPDQGKVEEFHTLLANIVRRFLEKQYQLPARHQTTQEFLTGLEKDSPLSSEQRKFLAHFLQHCDLAKFAQAQVSAEDCWALWSQTRTFVQ